MIGKKITRCGGSYADQKAKRRTGRLRAREDHSGDEPGPLPAWGSPRRLRCWRSWWPLWSRAWGRARRRWRRSRTRWSRALNGPGPLCRGQSYILYRQKRTELRAARQEIVRQLGDETLEPCLAEIQREFDQGLYSMTTLAAQFVGFVKPGMDREELLAALTKAAVELTSRRRRPGRSWRPAF